MTRPNLLFDLYGVLIRHRTNADRQGVAESLGIPAESRGAFWDAYHDLRAPLDRGELSDEQWWQSVSADCGVDFDIRAAIATETATLLEIHEDAVARVRDLIAQGYRVGVLSNIPHVLGQGLLDKYPWFSEFASVTFSCDIGLVKPDSAAYATALQQLGSAPADTIFFDDTAANVVAAADFGMRAVQYHDVSSIDTALEI